MPNPFIHAELAATNVPKAKAFCSKFFAWKLHDFPMPTPAGESRGGGLGAALMFEHDFENRISERS